MDKIIILDFGSQYNQLIARRVRELSVYSEIHPYNIDLSILEDPDVKGIILSGGPHSVYDDHAPHVDAKLFAIGKPILGICYGMQLTQYLQGGKVSPSQHREYGKSILNIQEQHKILNNVENDSQVWMSHGDHVDQLAPDYKILAQTSSCIAVAKHKDKDIYNFQFHPEVTHTVFGKQMIKNFVIDICKSKQDWSLDDYIEKTVAAIKQKVGKEQVILGLSGGVDSSVAAMLISKAIGSQLTAIFVDTGLLRKNEGDQVMQIFKDNFHIKVERVNAKDQFFKQLKGITDPEEKRKKIGNEFVYVFEKQKQKHTQAKFLAQGTIYPDVIESVSIKGPSQTIKSHHNVGGLPSEMTFELLEPLRELFKDEVREVGMKLGLSKALVYRHPFPGPGLGIRVLGEVTPEKVSILQEADDIFIHKLIQEGYYDMVSQAFVTLLPVKTVGVMGDQRTYEYICAIRSVDTVDFMTAVFSRLPFDFLDACASEIINKVKGINRVVYDITSKPPGTIEWE